MALFKVKPQFRRRGKTLSYYGLAPNLSNKVDFFAATCLSNYALIAGGQTSDNPPSTSATKIVNVYDKSLTKTTTELAGIRNNLSATHIGSYALFVGGRNQGNMDGLRTVEAFDESLSRSFPGNITYGRWGIGATHIGNYALFAGGTSGENWYGNLSNFTEVDAWNNSLTHSSPSRLDTGRGVTAATYVGNYAIFGGGYVGGGSDGGSGCVTDIDVYDTSLTKVSNVSRLAATVPYVATHVKDYAIFVGGNSWDQGSIEAFNSSLTKTVLYTASTLGYGTGATTVEGYALFGGGAPFNSEYTQRTVYAFDNTLVKTYPDILSTNRMRIQATHVGKYALFGGGINKTAGNNTDPVLYSDTVDVYQVA